MTDEQKKDDAEKVEWTDDELKQIAHDIVGGRIFTNWMLREPDEDMRMVFMPLALSPNLVKQLYFLDCGLIYEHMDEAGVHGVSGYPCFLSFHWLPRPQARKVFQYIRAIEKAMDAITLDEGEAT